MITVFTPAYNRRCLLERAFNSLKEQKGFRDFEWIIVDDGSQDGTKEYILSLLEKSEAESLPFNIRYFYQDNGGKHRAFNRGIKEAKGDLFFVLDSDDKLPEDALALVNTIYQDIKADNTFAGLCGLDADFEGNIIGSGLPQEIIDDNSIRIRYNYGITGDMKEVFKTSVLKEFPFPEFDGEKFCPEILVWNRIAKRYKLRYINKVIYLAEYQPTGLSSKITEIRLKSPKATELTYAEMMSLEIPIKQRIKAFLNLWRFRILSKL